MKRTTRARFNLNSNNIKRLNLKRASVGTVNKQPCTCFESIGDTLFFTHIQNPSSRFIHLYIRGYKCTNRCSWYVDRARDWFCIIKLRVSNANSNVGFSDCYFKTSVVIPTRFFLPFPVITRFSDYASDKSMLIHARLVDDINSEKKRKMSLEFFSRWRYSIVDTFLIPDYWRKSSFLSIRVYPRALCK